MASKDTFRELDKRIDAEKPLNELMGLRCFPLAAGESMRKDALDPTTAFLTKVGQDKHLSGQDFRTPPLGPTEYSGTH